MKKILQIISYLLLISISVGLMSSCRDGESTVAGGVTTVTVWTGNSHNKDMMMKSIEEYNAGEGKQAGIRIEYIVKEGATSEVLKNAFDDGTAPDILTSGTKYIKEGYLAALDDLPGGKEYIEKFREGLRNTIHTYHGKTYSVPIEKQLLGLIYNKDLFKKAGIVDENGVPTPPKTFDEVREYSKRISDLGDDIFGIALPLKWEGWFNCDIVSASLQEAGRKMYDPVNDKFDFNCYKPVLEMYMGIKEDKSYFPDPENLDNDQARAQFAEGRIGIKYAGSWDIGVLNDQFPAKCDWGVARLPVSELPVRYAQFGDADASYFINAASVDKIGGKTLMRVYKFLTSEEMQKKSYLAGKSFPYDPNVVKGLVVDKPKNGWMDFSDIAQYSMSSPIMPILAFDDGRDFESAFLNDVWTGKKTVDEIIAEMNEKYNMVYRQMIDSGQLNSEDYVDKEFNINISN